MIRRPPFIQIASPSPGEKSPRRALMWRMTTSSASITNVWSASAMPPPGALWPAMVTRGSRTTRSEASRIVPATSKRMVRGPRASTAARRLPGPLSARLVTGSTAPPRPPAAKRPAPSAPGKARICAAAGAAMKIRKKREGALGMRPPAPPPLETDARAHIELAARMMDHRWAVAIAVDELVVELVGEVDRLRGQSDVIVDLERGGRIDVERRILALDVVDHVLRRHALEIIGAIGDGAANAEPAVVIVKRGVPAPRRQVDEIVADGRRIGRRGHIGDL